MPPPVQPPPLPRRASPAQPPPLPPRAVPAQPPPLPRRASSERLPPLDLGLLADLPSLELRARYLVDSFLSGRHRSPRKGSSVEFAEYRDYQPGDDLRRVDWRLYGRTDRLHVKQYEEDTPLRVFVVLDVSASMDFSSRPALPRKIEAARLALAAVGLLAQRQGDAFGLGVAGEQLTDFLRARSSGPHWRVFVGRLETVAPAGQTSLARALEDLANVIPKRSILVVASDFYEEPAALQAALHRLRYDHHEVIGLHVLDPVEIDFDLEQAGTFVDAESGARLQLEAAAVRRGYLARFAQFCRDLDKTFQDAGGEVARLRTDQAPLEVLTRYLAQRAHRL